MSLIAKLAEPNPARKRVHDNVYVADHAADVPACVASEHVWVRTAEAPCFLGYTETAGFEVDFEHAHVCVICGVQRRVLTLDCEHREFIYRWPSAWISMPSHAECEERLWAWREEMAERYRWNTADATVGCARRART